MRRLGLYFLIFLAQSLNFVPHQGLGKARQQRTGHRLCHGHTNLRPRAEFLEEVADYEQRYTRLAEAVPILGDKPPLTL